MASPEILNIADLLGPIPGANASGEDIREDPSPNSIYYKIKDARNAARAVERQALMEYDPDNAPKPDWKPILIQGREILLNITKDLEIAAWMTEALLRRYGYPGLRDGFKLIRELCVKYWDTLFPLPDDYGMETRVFPLTGLNGDDAEGTLVGPISSTDITVDGYSVFQYRQACEVDKLEPDKKEQRLASGIVSLQVFEASVRNSKVDYYQNLLDDIEACIDEHGKLTEWLDEKCGSSAPPSSQIRNSLVDVRETVKGLVNNLLGGLRGDAPEAGDQQAATGDNGMVVAGGGNTGLKVSQGAIATREDAMRLLLQVADYFRRTEPHNPISYAVEQAVRWGRMSLPELMMELVADGSTRTDLFKRVGIPNE